MINTGWISVKNEMPSEHESVFAKLKGTLRWNTNMFEKISVDWNDDLEINYKGCPRAACEAYFQKDKTDCINKKVDHLV